MSDLSYLDTISNKELHDKCLQYGLPNIPVTDSSRQVILRRLRATILGVPLNKSKNATSAAKKTPRRETIHSSKATPSTEMNANNNRVAGKSPSRNNNNNTRRTIAAAAPDIYYPLENSSVRSMQTTTTVSDVGSQSEDDDYCMNKSPSFKYSNAGQREDERQRRSVSLTKSGVLTTSYTREVNQPHYEDKDDQPQSHTYQRPHVAPSHALPSYEPRVERTYSSGLPRQHLTQSLLNSTSYYEDTPDYNEQPIPQRSTYNGSAAPFNTGSAPNATIRQRQTIGDSGFARGRLIQPTYQANTLYPQLNEFYDQRTNNDEPMDLDTDSEPEADIHQQQQRSYGNTVESPYLSTFSRQLNAGKRSSPLSRPQPRQTLAKADQDSPREQFRLMLRTLDQKYHLKFYFFLMIAVVLTTLVYVVLTP
ncbi:LEM domain-containing protein Bocksbeutel [Drosophila innubila]|uniref:LEM domain-containing protein Bocksbeutel n=1 Tax=Drosophila innubila TaxID=198719 RepID=UPI00148DD5BB|nr:LEM domain-containing protein Bocksbeutel [Drosophila innubila]